MIRDLFVPVAEMLFWFTGGEMLVNTVWIFVWIIGGTVLLLIPFYLAFSAGRNRVRSLPAIVFLVCFFPVLLLITSPGIIQTQILEECLPDQTVTADTEQVKGIEVRVRQCRFKANFYDENFGEWQVWAVDKRQ